MGMVLYGEAGGINDAAKSPCHLATVPTVQERGKLKFPDQQLVIVKPGTKESTQTKPVVVQEFYG